VGYEIANLAGYVPGDAEILAVLRRDFPGKDFTVHNGTIIESYRTQPDYKTMLEHSPWYHRTTRAAASRVVAATESNDSSDYMARVMSNEV